MEAGRKEGMEHVTRRDVFEVHDDSECSRNFRAYLSVKWVHEMTGEGKKIKQANGKVCSSNPRGVRTTPTSEVSVHDMNRDVAEDAADIEMFTLLGDARITHDSLPDRTQHL